MTVGNRIKQRRLELGLTQTELAEKMGYSGKTSVCMAENRGDNITTTKVEKFAKALGVSTRWLMGYDDVEDYTVADPHLNIEIHQESRHDREFIARMREYYERYMNASPEVQSAIDLLLESSQKKQ